LDTLTTTTDGAQAPPAPGSVPGHNRPPLQDILKADHKPLLDRVADLRVGATKAPAKVETEEQARDVTTFVAQLKAAAKDMDAARKTAKQPYAEAAAAVDDFFRAGIDGLTKAAKDLERVLGEYLAEKQRREREEREAAERQAREAAAEARRQAEAAEREAAAKAQAGDRAAAADAVAAADAAREAAAKAEAEATGRKPASGATRGSGGGGAAVVTRYVFDIVDPLAVPRQYLEVNEQAIRAAIKAADKEALRDGTFSIPGVRIRPDTNAVVRTA
jgi:chemotaxis protein histidine kinase CheA